MKTAFHWIGTTVSTLILGSPFVAWAGPTLYYEKLWLDLSVSACLQKAEQAIALTEVPILNVNASRVLAVSPTVSVAIDCEAIDNQTRSIIMVSSDGNEPMTAINLTQTLKEAMSQINHKDPDSN
ncbi:hypothetical protein PJF56_12430 [Roseofilum sp. BLCC_M91]|uniref:DUF3718 domain-containing protein n=1 Tax=Roseofilum halophilum BLCC-M91 TaxID=3022259 RepID=A0ABT7BKF5_9CYAN|nr:hypothetical protein [Roseofilum halophilum]MDJ1179670.1 hypothetical protein [Roseofilum halophilum BLCC-M91]